MNKNILFYCYFENPAILAHGRKRLLVKAKTPKQAKQMAEEMVDEYYPRYKFIELAQVHKGSCVVEVSSLLGKPYSDGMLGAT